MKRKWKQQFTALFSAAALFMASGMAAFAAPAADASTVAGLCGHHTVHTAECLTGTACSHEHTLDCYSQSARCIHIHTGNCYTANGLLNCSHVCSQVNGCLTSTLNCQHVHDENCCYAQGATCSYSCNSCHASQTASTTQGSQYSSGSGCHGSSHHRSGRHH